MLLGLVLSLMLELSGKGCVTLRAFAAFEFREEKLDPEKVQIRRVRPSEGGFIRSFFPLVTALSTAHGLSSLFLLL